MAYLRHLINGSTLSLYELGDRVVIGRQIDCHIVIDDPTVSARHASLSREGSRYQLRDEQSTNGVRLNNQPVQAAVIEAGAIFSIGTHEFEFLEHLPTNLDKTLKIKKSWIPGVYYTE